ncbi:MAG: DUF6493 family protein, partial [Actinoplanes sp.]
MSLEWAVFDGRVSGGNLAAVRRMLVDATEAERLVFGREVEARLRAMKPEDWWRSPVDPSGGYGLAVLGTAPSAAKAAALLGRRDMREKWSRIPVQLAVDVVHARALPWLGDLGVRLAERLDRQGDAESWRLVAALLNEAGTSPPITEGVLRGWLVDLADDHAPLTDRLRRSPYLDLLLPAVFEIDGMGGQLSWLEWGRSTDRPAFPAAVAALVAEGRLERRTILDATVDRLVRGDRPAWLRPFVLLHEALAPTPDELAGHALDYARLLPDAPSATAGLAQRALRTVDDAGRLDLDTLLDVSRPTLVRTEKTLVKAQLTWLDRVARRNPARAADVLATVAAAFDHPSLDIQDRALTLISRHAPHLHADPLARLAAAATGLAGDLPPRAAALFGPRRSTSPAQGQIIGVPRPVRPDAKALAAIPHPGRPD